MNKSIVTIISKHHYATHNRHYTFTVSIYFSRLIMQTARILKCALPQLRQVAYPCDFNDTGQKQSWRTAVTCCFGKNLLLNDLRTLLGCCSYVCRRRESDCPLPIVPSIRQFFCYNILAISKMCRWGQVCVHVILFSIIRLMC